MAVDQEAYYRGIRMVPYDLLKELALAFAGITAAVIVLAALLSSPDIPSVTIETWSQHDAVDFVTTATSELAGQSASAQYGPPYTDGSGATQTWGPIAPELWAGVHLPINPPQDFVLGPLGHAATGNAQVAEALKTWSAADAQQQQTWLTNYLKALAKATDQQGQVVTANGDYGPLPTLMNGLLAIARTGGLDGLLQDTSHFYATDFTRPLLFLGDSGYLADQANQQHLQGSQWGVMNETGSYPGQAWLWLYTMWYQIPPFNSAANADLLVALTMGFLTVVLALVPFIPGLRDIPRWVPIHRLIWRR
ncbi:MAG TPA: hypothetical protein VMW62_08670 [Chloroflexota bacterium]|nr:hypothetical protein [Chloroflexota bacterium]